MLGLEEGFEVDLYMFGVTSLKHLRPPPIKRVDEEMNTERDQALSINEGRSMK